MTKRNIGLLQRLVFFLMLLLLPQYPIFAQEGDSMEHKIKAAYLYNFTKFINWPEDSSPSFNLCVVGETPLLPILTNLESKTALDKPIRIVAVDNIKQLNHCHIAYFEHLAKTEDGVFHSAYLAKTLTVGSQTEFTKQGGMIGFVLENEKIKLFVNLKALKQQGLTMSAKLIEVATLVEE